MSIHENSNIIMSNITNLSSDLNSLEHEVSHEINELKGQFTSMSDEICELKETIRKKDDILRLLICQGNDNISACQSPNKNVDDDLRERVTIMGN